MSEKSDKIQDTLQGITNRVLLENLIDQYPPVNELYWKHYEAMLAIKRVVQVFGTHSTALTDKYVQELAERGIEPAAATAEIIHALEAARTISKRA